MEWNLLLDILYRDLKSKNILRKMNSVSRTEESIISCFINNEELRENIGTWLNYLPANTFKKSQNKSKEKKKKGHSEFKLKNYEKSRRYYTKTMQYAPSKNEDYFEALAYRSVSLFHLKKFKESKRDAENCLVWDFSPDMKFKLYRQLSRCCSKLNENQLMKNYLSEASAYLESSKLTAKDKEKFEVLKQQLLQESEDNRNNIQSQTDETLHRIPEPDFGYNPSFASASSAIDKKYDETKGRYVIANRNIKKKQILFVEKPFAFVILDHARNESICTNCCKSRLYGPTPCWTCYDVVYCDEDCRDESWNNHHQWECIGNIIDLWKQIGIAHLSIRVFLTSASTQDIVQFNNVQSLVTNITKVSTEDLAVYCITAMMLMLYLRIKTELFDIIDLKKSFADKITDKNLDFDFDLSTDRGKESYAAAMLLRFMLQMICNGHSITGLALYDSDNNMIQDTNQVRIATAIYPSASMMNHSCDPNIMNSFMGQYLIIKCTRDIPEGQEVFNCYGPHYRRMLTSNRQESLKKQYCFTCQCVPCTDKKYKNFRKRFQSFKCPSCEGPLNLDCGKVCQDCGNSFEIDISAASEMFKADQIFKEATTYLSETNVKSALEKAKQCLMIRQRILYKYNDSLAYSFDLIGKIYAISGQYLDAIEHLEQYLEIIKERYGEDSLDLVEELNKITDICILYLENVSNSGTEKYKTTLAKTEAFLKQAEEILDLNTGFWSEQYKEFSAKKKVILNLRSAQLMKYK